MNNNFVIFFNLLTDYSKKIFFLNYFINNTIINSLEKFKYDGTFFLKIEKKIIVTNNLLSQLKVPYYISFFYPNLLNNFSIVKNKLLLFQLFCKNDFMNQNNYVICGNIKNDDQLNYFYSIELIAELIFFGQKNLSHVLLKILFIEFNSFKNELGVKSFVFKNINSIKKFSSQFKIITNLINLKIANKHKIGRNKKIIKPNFFKNFIKQIKHRKDRLTKKILRILKKSKNSRYNYFAVIRYKKKWNLKQYNNLEIYRFFDKLVSLSTKRGLKKKAYKIILDSLISARKELNLKIRPFKMLLFIFKKLNPIFILKKFTIGRRSIIIPFPMRKEKKISHTARLFLNSLKKRSELSFKKKLIEEIKDFFKRNKKPLSLKARDARIKLALENKGNLRFLRFI